MHFQCTGIMQLADCNLFLTARLHIKYTLLHLQSLFWGYIVLFIENQGERIDCQGIFHRKMP